MLLCRLYRGTKLLKSEISNPLLTHDFKGVIYGHHWMSLAAVVGKKVDQYGL